MRLPAFFLLILISTLPAAAQADRPVLISQATSTRAIAFASPLFTTEPFSPGSLFLWDSDQRTRVMLFAQNLTLAPGEDLSTVTADAEDEQHHLFNLQVEYLGPVPGQAWLTAVVLRLSDDLGDVGDVLVRVTYQGQSSNRVRVGIGHVGGGLPDDPNSAPTPVLAYLISGRLTINGAGLTNVSVSLGGTTGASTTTDNNGAYSFTVNRPGNYTVTPSLPFYKFSPQSIVFDYLTNNHTEANFTASRNAFSIGGRVTDGAVPVAGVTVSLGGWTKATAVTDAFGAYLFPNLDVGHDYTLTPASDSVFSFSPSSVSNLTSDIQVNLEGLRHTYSISGQVKGVDSHGLAGVAVTLTGGDLSSQTVGTDAQGFYSFTGVKAGYGYTITPASNRLLAFTPQVIQNLTNDSTLNFQAARRTYSLRGRVMEGARPINGATVTLSGWTSATTVTDTSGSYLFPNLEAGRDYKLTPARPLFDFAPQEQPVENMLENLTADFKGTPTYNLTGRTTDDLGNGLGGVTITLGGAESGVFKTAADGTYSITLHTTGDYTVTASTAQNYFTFSTPTHSLQNVDSDRSAYFQGALSLTTDPAYVLEFDGTPMTVDCGPFWPPAQPLGHFFWEVWAAPGEDAGAGYMISDGYGGAHAILFGFAYYNGREPNRYALFGDLWNGSDFVFFSSDEGPAIGEWGHYAVGWDGRQIITYFNGVPVGRTAFSGERISPGSDWGAGRLLIGGSDHNNLVGRIAEVRGYEERNPREDTSVTAAFVPEAVFGREGNYLGYFFRPSQQIADVSASYYQGQVHTGRLRGTLYPYGLLTECPDCPLPRFVLDPTAPKFLSVPVNTSAPVAANPSAPAEAVVYDSFSRANSTYALGMGGLGSTEGGSAGPKLWQTVRTSAGLEPFGLLNGRAVLLANQTAMAWVETNSSDGNLDIRVKRHAGFAGSGFDTGVAFRVIDDHNYFFAYTSGGDDDDAPATSRKLTVGYYLGGVRTELVSNLSLADNWTELQVRTRSNGQLTVSTDGEIVYSAGSGIMANATGAGIYSNGPGAGLLNRWDDFVVYNLP